MFKLFWVLLMFIFLFLNPLQLVYFFFFASSILFVIDVYCNATQGTR
uniref:Uncharacterized protein MANES_16G053000 n=1 Tax=Rhizophora mucronata TaxID=61149 RepID=A0A2P2M1L5_RHIMU